MGYIILSIIVVAFIIGIVESSSGSDDSYMDYLYKEDK